MKLQLKLNGARCEREKCGVVETIGDDQISIKLYIYFYAN